MELCLYLILNILSFEGLHCLGTIVLVVYKIGSYVIATQLVLLFQAHLGLIPNSLQLPSQVIGVAHWSQIIYLFIHIGHKTNYLFSSPFFWLAILLRLSWVVFCPRLGWPMCLWSPAHLFLKTS